MADYRDDSSGDYREWRQGDYSPCRCRWEWWPRQLSMTAKGWWKAAHLTQTAARIVPTWNDRIGGFGPLRQPVSSKAPVLIPGRINGQPAVVFDGADDFISSAAITAIAQPYTMLLVYKIDGITGSHYICDGVGATDRAILYYSGTGWGMAAGGAYGVVSPITTKSYRMIAKVNGAASSITVNGAELVGDAGAGSMGGFTLGGKYTGDTLMAPISVAEVVVAKGLPSAADVNLWRAYVAQEYGL